MYTKGKTFQMPLQYRGEMQTLMPEVTASGSLETATKQQKKLMPETRERFQHGSVGSIDAR